MTASETLNIVTLIMCVITLTIASLALMPQIKQGLTILRDSVLWAVLLAIVVAVGAVGWHRLVEARQRPLGDQTTAGQPAGEPLAADPQGSEDQFATMSHQYSLRHRPWDRVSSDRVYLNQPRGPGGF